MTVEPDDTGGLGYVSKAGELCVTLELEPPVTAAMGQLSLGGAPDCASSNSAPDPATGTGRKKRAGRVRTARKSAREGVSLELQLHQDPSGLHARSGETGTVLWRSSLALAENTLRTLVFEPPGWLDWGVRVLELGAGVGLLAAALGALSKHWTATDYLHENLRLVRRNCAENAGVRAEIARLVGRPSAAQNSSPGDAAWEDEEDTKEKKGRRRTERHAATAAAEVEMPTLTQLDWTHVSMQRARGNAEVPSCDLVLAVDCLYNEHLVRPLVDTLATACQAGAVAFVVVELRSSDVVSPSVCSHRTFPPHSGLRLSVLRECAKDKARHTEPQEWTCSTCARLRERQRAHATCPAPGWWRGDAERNMKRCIRLPRLGPGGQEPGGEDPDVPPSFGVGFRRSGSCAGRRRRRRTAAAALECVRTPALTAAGAPGQSRTCLRLRRAARSLSSSSSPDPPHVF